MKTELIHQYPTTVTLDGQALTRADVLAVARHYAPVIVGDHAIRRVQAARQVIDTIAAEGKKIYGVTTGFGHLSSVRIPQAQLVALQHNLLRSHASGVGEPLTEEITSAMMLLLAASLARGNSGVRVEIVQILVAMLNSRLANAANLPSGQFKIIMILATTLASISCSQFWHNNNVSRETFADPEKEKT